MTISPNPASVQVGQTLQLTTGQSGVKWSSSNTAVATVSSNGLVTGKSAGTATIRAQKKTQRGSATVTVQASAPVPVPDPVPVPVPDPVPVPGGVSPSGTIVPPASQLIDAQGHVWTVDAANAALLRDGAGVGSGHELLWWNGTIYAKNRSWPDANGSWWQHDGAGGWGQIAGDPRGTSTPTVPVPSVPLSASITLLSINNDLMTVGLSAAPVGASWRLAWGDGATETGAVLPSSRQHRYAQDGEYTVRLTVSDSSGATAEDTVAGKIIIANRDAHPVVGGQEGLISGLMLDDFENSGGTLRMASGVQVVTHQPGGNTGVASVSQSTVKPYQGTSHFRANVTAIGSAYGLYVGFRHFGPPGGGGSYIDQLYAARTSSATPWTFDYYNRLRFWIRFPTTYCAPGTNTGGDESFNIQMFNRSSPNDTASQQEAGGYHFYTFYRATGTGTYWQFIYDYHPTHTRAGTGPLPGGSPGWDTQSDLWETQNWGASGTEYPTQEAGQNFMDRWSTFDIAFSASFSPSATGIYDIDGIEFYRDPNDVPGNRLENMTKVMALGSNYRASDNLLTLTWFRWRDDDTIPHDVRYAFSDIHALGWNNATPLATVQPTSSGPAGVMWLETTSISMGANNFIYIAIKPQNESTFRQIIHPVTGPATV